MSSHVIFTPSTLDFGHLQSSDHPSATIAALKVPADGTMSVTLSDDTSNGGFKVSGLKSSILVSVDPNNPELPVPKGPHTHPGQTLEILDSSDGARAIDVPQGSNASVSVAFLPPSTTAAKSYSAVLRITSQNWDPVIIALTAAVAGTQHGAVSVPRISTTVPTTDFSVNQNSIVQVPIEITSITTLTTDLFYENFPRVHGVGLSGERLTVGAGTTESSLLFEVDDKAVLGPHQIRLVQSSLSNGQDRFPVKDQITFTILPPQGSVDHGDGGDN
jgi:hypothetical protein